MNPPYTEGFFPESSEGMRTDEGFTVDSNIPTNEDELRSFL